MKQLMPVSADEVFAHIEATNPHRGGRNAWTVMPENWREYRWMRGQVPVDMLPPVQPASKDDVRKYARKKGVLPAVVLIVALDEEILVDGKHRVAAARRRKQSDISAYIGFVQ